MAVYFFGHHKILDVRFTLVKLTYFFTQNKQKFSIVMKKVFSFLSLFLALSIVITSFSSCTEEEPVLDTEKFIGTYSGTESCNTGDHEPVLNITESSIVEGRIVINHSDGYPITATVSGSSYTIDAQQVEISNQLFELSGSGSLSGTVLTGTLIRTLNGVNNNCSWSFEKQ